MARSSWTFLASSRSGSFGFYNLSQQNVRYAGLRKSPHRRFRAVELVLLGMGALGAGAWRRFRSV